MGNVIKEKYILEVQNLKSKDGWDFLIEINGIDGLVEMMVVCHLANIRLINKVNPFSKNLLDVFLKYPDSYFRILREDRVFDFFPNTYVRNMVGEPNIYDLDLIRDKFTKIFSRKVDRDNYLYSRYYVKEEDKKTEKVNDEPGKPLDIDTYNGVKQGKPCNYPNNLVYIDEWQYDQEVRKKTEDEELIILEECKKRSLKCNNVNFYV